jgi:SAM-dependent methyltransferase
MDSSNIVQMRSFHNFIKKELLKMAKVATDGESILDIAVGRGGDIAKWIRCDYKLVVGIDNDRFSIREAIDRFKKTKGKRPYVIFKELDILRDDANTVLSKIERGIKNFSGVYNVVSCQFAMHYFSENDETLLRVLRIVSNRLDSGGCFIGTAADGDAIQHLLNNGNIKIDLLELLAVSPNSYTFNITSNTHNTYFDVNGKSYEYYLYKDKLIDLARSVNLFPLDIKSFSQWYEQDYEGTIANNEAQVSFLNFSFAFQKL